ELLFNEALIRRELKDPKGAEECLLRLRTPRDANHFASVDAGLAGYKASHNLAMLYQEQGRFTEAETEWQGSLTDPPGYVPALMGLCEVCLQQGRWTNLDQAITRLAREGGSAVDAAVMRARGHLGRTEYTKARQILEETIARAPTALWPRQIL